MASNGGAFRSPRIQVVSAFVVGPARSFRKGGVPPEFWLMRNPDLVGGWTNPFEKYARQIGNLPQVGVKIKNIWNHHLGNPHVFLNKKQGRTSINPTCWCGKSWYFGRPFVCLHSVLRGGKKDPTNNRTKQSHTGCASWWPKACFSAELGWILGWKSALERPLVPQKQITDPISFTKFYRKKKVVKWLSDQTKSWDLMRYVCKASRKWHTSKSQPPFTCDCGVSSSGSRTLSVGGAPQAREVCVVPQEQCGVVTLCDLPGPPEPLHHCLKRNGIKRKKINTSLTLPWQRHRLPQGGANVFWIQDPPFPKKVTGGCPCCLATGQYPQLPKFLESEPTYENKAWGLLSEQDQSL